MRKTDIFIKADCYKNWFKREGSRETTKNLAILDLDLKMKSYKNGMKKIVTLDLQMKLTDILIIKRDTQIINQNNDLDNFWEQGTEFHF